MKACAFFIAFLCCCCLQAKDFVFIGSYNRNKNKQGIYICTLDTVTGKLHRVTSVSSILNPAYLTISPDGRHLYACTEAQIPGGGKVNCFQFDPYKGTLTFINDRKSEGENPVYLAVHKSGNWLINANYTSGTISVYPLGQDGSIQPPCQVLAFAGSGPNTERQTSPHIHATVFSPDNNYLFAPDLGADKIRCFSFDAAAQAPLQPATIPHVITAPGSGPRHFTFHPGSKFCYCIEELSGTIAAYTYNDGKPDRIQGISSYRGTSAIGYHSADIHISPDGLFLYASNREPENNISIFAIDTNTGTMSLVGHQSTLGEHPRTFAIDPSGKFLLVANQESGSVVVFKRDAKSGKLTDTHYRAKVPGVSYLQIRSYTN